MKVLLRIFCGNLRNSAGNNFNTEITKKKKENTRVSFNQSSHCQLKNTVLLTTYQLQLTKKKWKTTSQSPAQARTL